MVSYLIRHPIFVEQPGRALEGLSVNAHIDLVHDSKLASKN
jgi:hypothetical protein